MCNISLRALQRGIMLYEKQKYSLHLRYFTFVFWINFGWIQQLRRRVLIPTAHFWICLWSRLMSIVVFRAVHHIRMGDKTGVLRIKVKIIQTGKHNAKIIPVIEYSCFITLMLLLKKMIMAKKKKKNTCSYSLTFTFIHTHKHTHKHTPHVHKQMLSVLVCVCVWLGSKVKRLQRDNLCQVRGFNPYLLADCEKMIHIWPQHHLCTSSHQLFEDFGSKATCINAWNAACLDLDVEIKWIRFALTASKDGADLLRHTADHVDAHTAFKALISTSPHPVCALVEQLAMAPLVEMVFKADFGGGEM